MPPSSSAAAKKQPLTLAQLSTYDDILTDALVDHVSDFHSRRFAKACRNVCAKLDEPLTPFQAFYWTTIPKNRPSYHPSRGIKEEEIANIIQSHLVVEPDLDAAEAKLLATDGLRRFYQGLRTTKEKDDFRGHLRRYMNIYLPDCPFEVSSTNRYTIVTHEARVTARKYIRKGQPVKYLSGIQVLISLKEEEALSARKKDFSIVVSSRNKCASLFMGPARFANHDCGANAHLKNTGQAGIEITATRDIDVGDEITVSYGGNYFGEDNCECLCKTCEDNLVNGWSQPDGNNAVRSIEEAVVEGYSLRRRRRDGSAASASRTPSVTPDLRPRVPKSRSKTSKAESGQVSLVGSPGPESLLREKRKREFESLTTPPVTPAKKQKTLHYELQPMSAPALSRRSSEDESIGEGSASGSSSGDILLTDVTTPESDTKEPILCSPEPSPEKSQAPPLKQEESVTSTLSNVTPAPVPIGEQDSITAIPLPTIESTPKPFSTTEDINSDGGKDALRPIESRVSPTLANSATRPADEAASNAEEMLSPRETSDSSDGSSNPDRGRGRTRTRAQPEPETEDEDEEAEQTTSQRVRTPGDYSLTPVLLSEPDTAWVYCTICNEAFVQQNAYFTRSACPRCERHSKLYGYQWPKTEKEGPHDKEERVLDHRTVHRFLDREDELRIRGRKIPSSAPAPKSRPARTTATASSITAASTIVETVSRKRTRSETPASKGPRRPRKQSRLSTDGPDDDFADRSISATNAATVGRSDSTRRSARQRRPSLRVAAC